jgi:hypothetical protein
VENKAHADFEEDNAINFVIVIIKYEGFSEEYCPYEILRLT